MYVHAKRQKANAYKDKDVQKRHALFAPTPPLPQKRNHEKSKGKIRTMMLKNTCTTKVKVAANKKMYEKDRKR